MIREILKNSNVKTMTAGNSIFASIIVDRKTFEMTNEILSERVLSLPESATIQMTRKSRELKLQGKDIITLSIGEPDFDTPENIKNAAVQAIHDNITHYPPVAGFLEVRKAIAHKLKRDNVLDYDYSQIIISNGAKQSLANFFMVSINKGDEVIIPTPYWVTYPALVTMAEGTPVFVEGKMENNFKITAEQLEAAITPKTKVFLINSPGNPTGSVYSGEELEALAEVLKKYPDIIIVSDEIYELILFDRKHESIAKFAGLKERTVIINGVSKGFAMTGWRIGYAAAPKALADAMNKWQSQYTSGPSTISQMAALEAFKIDPANDETLGTMVETFKKRRDSLIGWLKEIPGIRTNTPRGAFYVLPDFKNYIGKKHGDKLIKDTEDLCMYLLEEANVAVVPGGAFGAPGFDRIS
jgi:aspartate aminotransferase